MTLTRELRQALIQKCAALCLVLADSETLASHGPERMLNAEEAATRMGKTERWMKGAGRKLPFARKVGLSWGWVESGLVAYLQRRKWSG